MYDLHSLGWHSFQQLCLTITRETLGQTVQAFLDTADGGRDGAFTGIWKQMKAEALSGRFIIQCKFTSLKRRNLRVEDLAEEAEKAERLAKAGRCDCYVLMTNAGVSGTVEEAVETLFRARGVKQVITFGKTWICDQIRESGRLRMLVPRLYGLGDLSQILDERAYLQAKTLLATLRDDMAKVVITSAYQRAAEALDQHGFVLLIGEPAAGKTTIASMLAISALDQWGCSTLKLDTPQDVVKHWNPDEPAQFFWIDDAFGVQQYESFLAYGWNHALPQAKAMLRKGSRIVMTSRDYIYRAARNDLKEGAFPLFREGKVVIDVRDLTKEEREQILYNHIKLGHQSSRFRKEIKPHLDFIASHSRFIPETARRLGDPLFTRGLNLDRFELGQFVDKQQQLLQEVIAGLDDHSRAALGLVYMRNGILESPVELVASESAAVERLGSDLGACVAALDYLNGSLMQFAQMRDSAQWRFKHPTVGDAFASYLLKNPELLGIYLRGSSTENLIGQITCGDVGLERAVIVPRTLFSLVIERLGEFSSSNYKNAFLSAWHRRERLDYFLRTRCSKEFLIEYLKAQPETFARISDPGLMLSASSEVDLALHLHELGLLPESCRAEFASKIAAYAIDGEDLYAIENIRIQSIFTDAEMSSFRRQWREQLIPDLGSIRRRWESNYDSGQQPEDFMQSLTDGLEALKREFLGDAQATDSIDVQRGLIEEWIAEKLADHSPPSRTPREYGDMDRSEPMRPSSRSIFDDIDK